MSGFVILLREQGFNSFFKGWVPTLVGYSAQGACKFGLYEFFKKLYSDTVKHGHQSVIYLAASASAEMFADVMLCPLEAIKIRVQTQPGFAMGLCDGLPKFIKSDGALGYEYFVSCVFFLISSCGHCWYILQNSMLPSSLMVLWSMNVL